MVSFRYMGSQNYVPGITQALQQVLASPLGKAALPYLNQGDITVAVVDDLGSLTGRTGTLGTYDGSQNLVVVDKKVVEQGGAQLNATLANELLTHALEDTYIESIAGRKGSFDAPSVQEEVMGVLLDRSFGAYDGPKGQRPGVQQTLDAAYTAYTQRRPDFAESDRPGQADRLFAIWDIIGFDYRTHLGIEGGAKIHRFNQQA